MQRLIPPGRPSKRRKTVAAALPPTDLPTATSERHNLQHREIRSSYQEGKRAQTPNQAYWNTIMNLGEEEAETDAVCRAGRVRAISEIRDVHPIDLEFFDVKFNRNRVTYTIVPLKENLPPWRILDVVASCPLRDERIHSGDYVVIRLQGERVPSGEKNYAKVREIRTLPDPDARPLIRVAWLYRVGNRLYESNHYQIMLWDTVDGILNTSQQRQIRRDSLYDACQRMQICNVVMRRQWQSLEQQIFGHVQK
ncbi:hypothetical protein, variant 2 [Exophiala oligosperma]|uniref:Uncharacterized protein n=1 Tax=Exophiala oligosperma TaxID=215243 RepID=A0A0D2CZV0_9EURO|nr:hypothetical protein, variant 2 [Exophiala oligosperma]KIW36503.1 hypothetical protein, variant 2 [Exophiala oligosperma]